MIAGKLGHTRSGPGNAAPYVTTVADLIAAGYELQNPDAPAQSDAAATIERLRDQLDAERNARERAERDAADWREMAGKLADSLDGLRALLPPATASQSPDSREDSQRRANRIMRLFGKA